MSLIKILLWPLTALLQVLLETMYPLVGSYGVAIMMLSLLVSAALTPVTGLARRLEARETARQQQMAPQIAQARQDFVGRERFERIDAIYQQFGYHPIKSMVSLLPLFLQLPFLLSALFLLVDYGPLSGESFWIVPDLSKPDQVLDLGVFTVNLIPILLTAVAMLDAILRKGSTPQSRMRFLIVSAVLLVLIYPFPAGVCLYWLTSNLVSLCRSVTRS